MKKFTGNSWHEHEAKIIAYDEEGILQGFVADMVDRHDMDANARLIANAPAMYFMLKTASEVFNGTPFALSIKKLLMKIDDEKPELNYCPFCECEVSIENITQNAASINNLANEKRFCVVCKNCNMLFGFEPGTGGIFHSPERAKEVWQLKTGSEQDD